MRPGEGWGLALCVHGRTSWVFGFKAWSCFLFFLPLPVASTLTAMQPALSGQALAPERARQGNLGLAGISWASCITCLSASCLPVGPAVLWTDQE